MFTYFSQAMSLLTSRQRRKVYLILVTSAVASAVQTVSILSLMPFIVLLTNPDLHETNVLLQRLYGLSGAGSYQAFLALFGVFAIVALILGNLFIAFEQWISVRFLSLLSHDLQKGMLRRILTKPYAHIATSDSATLSDVVLQQVARVVDGVIGTFISIFSSIALAALIVLALLLISLKTTLLSLLGLLVAYVGVFLLLRRRVEADGQESTRLSASVFAAVKEALDGIREIQTRRAVSWFVRRFESSNLRKAKLAIHHSMMDFLPHYLMETAVFAGFVGVALYFLFTTSDAGVSLSYIALYGIAVYRLVPALKGLFEGMSTLHHNGDAVRAVLEHCSEDALTGVAQELEMATRAVSLQGVTFRYPNGDRDQLTGLDLVIPVGSSVCLFGPSGSGKTTVLNLVAGLLSPREGVVLCDDVVLGSRNLDSWRKMIGYAPQHAYLIADSLASNIAFGVDADDIDRERVIEAGRMANLHDFISTELADSYETVVAERGDSLSGGQRQRIGIARALYHDPQIVILDESFANLDAENRTIILDRLFGLGKTLIFSSHDAAVASRCSKVVVMEQGAVLVEGRFQDLLRESPRFVELLAVLNHERSSE